ncbi:hypothetical protein KC19_6G198900 [Ceratodon purpureus]|uniref:Uncharacterized protein n=1 Tax=Ceratodon purpureus TaxID=3225 RepID=A0A8T0HJG7_CERPU|nr:hypothetical protein KC19_6G198900 [Ceratodon purpureus]
MDCKYLWGLSALGDLGAFVNVGEHNSVPCFYSCEIDTLPEPLEKSYRGPPHFKFLLVRRRNLAIESECQILDKSPIYFIEALDGIFDAIRILVACPTLTEVRFSDSCRSASPPYESLGGSYLQALVCENPRLETFRVSTNGMNFVRLAKAVAVCFSRNTVLKSFTLRIRIPIYELEQNRESLEILLRPFTSSSPSEANAHLKELALDLQYADGYCLDAIVNLVCRNTTLKKLDLRFSKFWSCLKDGKPSWTEFCKALEVNQTLEELSCPCEVAELRELLVPFVPDRYGRQPNTTLSTLRLSIANEVHGRGVDVLLNNLVVVLRDLASALQLNTTLKHVECIYECNTDEEYQRYDREWHYTKYITDKNLWQYLELQIQEILRTMIDNDHELRMNTTLESLAVGHWTLRRVGTEWQTSYRGPCLRKQPKEYNVKVKMTP